jgi:hypothetical protein
MTNIDVQYYSGSSWNNLTSFTSDFTINKLGIQGVSNAQINLEGPATDFTSYLSNPFKLLRVRAYLNSAYRNLFFGYANKPLVKTIGGTLPERYKLNIQCLCGSARIANDTITMDYYKLQSALSPYNGAEAWTYRKMLNDIFAHPDSLVDTGFTVEAATDLTGLDHILETACTWSQQTIFDVVRTVCDRVSYDGYYDLIDESSNWKTVLAPFTKASVATFTGHTRKNQNTITAA